MTDLSPDPQGLPGAADPLDAAGEPTQPLWPRPGADWVPPHPVETSAGQAAPPPPPEAWAPPRHAAPMPAAPTPAAPMPAAPPMPGPVAGPASPGPFPPAVAGAPRRPEWGPPPTTPLRYPGPTHLASGAAPAGRVPAWLWPVVSMLALVVGGLGGALGGAAYERLTDEPTATDLPTALPGDQAPLPAGNTSIAAVAKRLLPSTVQIVARSEGEDSGATGSGFVIDERGHIVTNNHVVAGAADGGRIQIVDQAGNRYDAKLVGRSPVYDLAVLYAAEAARLRPAALGSVSRLRVGDEVVAIGSPLGLTSTVTAGIVSAVGRPVTTGNSDDDTSYINAVQTDAAINPGNSGGPLVNLAGQVVGVNSAIATTGATGGEAGNIGVGFAIPIDQVRTTARQILADGEARYPVIGATVRTGASVGTEEPPGARIDEVTSGAPADRAGLRKDDLITAIDGDRVGDGIALIVAIRTHQPGDTVSLTVSRDGRERTVEVTLDSKVG